MLLLVNLKNDMNELAQPEPAGLFSAKTVLNVLHLNQGKKTNLKIQSKYS